MADSGLPAPWYLISVLRACSVLPCAESQRGLSGMSQTSESTTMPGTAWMRIGTRHDQFEVNFPVP
jgi:hypothetical protein